MGRYGLTFPSVLGFTFVTPASLGVTIFPTLDWPVWRNLRPLKVPPEETLVVSMPAVMRWGAEEVQGRDGCLGGRGAGGWRGAASGFGLRLSGGMREGVGGGGGGEGL